MKTRYQWTRLVVAASVLVLPVIWADDVTAMCLPRNRLRPGQSPLPWGSQPTWRTFDGYPGSSGTNDGTRWAARFLAPSGIAARGSNEIIVADSGNYTIRRIGPDGLVSTLAGAPGISGHEDGPPNVALFSSPTAVVADTNGNLLVADGSCIREISSQGIVSTMAGQALTNGYADGTGTNALFGSIQGLTFGNNGSLFAADGPNNVIREITPAGVVSTVAGNPRIAGWQDGVGTNAWFSNPVGIAVDNDGNLYVADSGNQVIRKVAPGGLVTTIAGQAGSADWQDTTGTNAWFNSPHGLTLDPTGNLYIADSGNSCIRKISLGGDVSTVAGVPRGSAHEDGSSLVTRFFSPVALAFWQSHLLVADAVDNTIRYGSLGAEPHPEFLEQPVNTIVPQGSNAVFQVIAQSAAPLAYQWFYSDGLFDGYDQVILGATNATLVLTNADYWSGQVFRAAISDGTGCVFSLPASLQIIPTPPPASSLFSHWHLLATTPVQTISAVAYGNGHYIAIGTDTSGSTAIVDSTDGTQWRKKLLLQQSQQWMSSPMQLNGIAFGNGRFVVVGTGGMVLTSTDASNWNSQALTPLTAPVLQSIAFDQGLFVAATDDDNGSLWTSSDGVTWTNTGFELERHFQKVIAGGGKFVAVGNTIQASSNGLDWVSAQLPDGILGDYGDFDSVAYGNGVFVATKQPSSPGGWSCGNQGLLISVDSANWVDMTPTNGLSLSRVTFGNGYFAALDSVTGGITISADGFNWSQPLPISGNSTITGLCFAEGVFITTETDALENATLLSSTNGIAWTRDNQGQTIPFPPAAVLNVNGRYFGCGSGGIMTSTNASDWTALPLTNGNWYNSIAYGKNTLVAFGTTPQNGTHNAQNAIYAIASSTDGGNHWNEQSLASNDGTWQALPRQIVFGNNTFLAVGDIETLDRNPDTHIITSTDGQNWKFAEVPGVGVIQSLEFGPVAYGNGAYVAVLYDARTTSPNYGRGSVILWSDTGANWYQAFSATNGNLSSLCFGSGQFIVGGSDQADAMVLSSSDGIVWTRQTLPIGGLPYLVYGSGLFVGDTGSSTFVSSLNGHDWTTSFSDLGGLSGLWSAEGIFLAYGQDEFGNQGLFQSDPIERLGQPKPLPDGRFQFSITGARHLDYHVEASDTLLNWQVIGTVSNSPPTQSFTDTDAPGHSHRFYRVITH